MSHKHELRPTLPPPIPGVAQCGPYRDFSFRSPDGHFVEVLGLSARHKFLLKWRYVRVLRPIGQESDEYRGEFQLDDMHLTKAFGLENGIAVDAHDYCCKDYTREGRYLAMNLDAVPLFSIELTPDVVDSVRSLVTS